MAPNKADTVCEEPEITLSDISEREQKIFETVKTEKLKWFFFREEWTIRWEVVALHTFLYAVTIYGLLTYPYFQRYTTLLWAYFVYTYSMFGVTGGIHRYWSHKCFKARLPLRLLLAFCYISANQVPFRSWIQIHRVHHKFTDTDADPHNSRRGFFYCHVGWLMIKRPKEVVEKFKKLDMTDIDADGVVRFCDRHFTVLRIIALYLSIAVPVYCWNESWYYSSLAQFMRYVISLNTTFTVNSFAHMFGYKPYDKNILPAENRFVVYATHGEGWHNYHHTFPYDYRSSEIGGSKFDLTATLIRFFERIGWAYDLKQPSDSLVEKTVLNRGDGTLLKSLMN
ncbi:unnamed protein product [Trichogramma brassicae]|uniref:Fatty acid desaturase domain-containing protein n=1 Tax=Trichogramma brassicae TaxID=86971 RepID=A0A6H5IUB8_9HYME|nr:unnamed protein product [Trichogramma brassicae]